MATSTPTVDVSVPVDVREALIRGHRDQACFQKWSVSFDGLPILVAWHKREASAALASGDRERSESLLTLAAHISSLIEKFGDDWIGSLLVSGGTFQ